MRLRSVLAACATVLVGTLSLAPGAFAADGGAADLIALTAHDPTTYGSVYQVRPGETIAVEAGVANATDKPVSGVYVHLWFIGSEQRLTDNFSNCQYYLDIDEQGAWCEFDQELAAGGKYSLPPLHVSVPAGATETRTLVEVAVSKEFVDSQGGIAHFDVPETLVPGTGGKASLVEGSDLTPNKEPSPTSFVYFDLILPSAAPSAHPSASPSASLGAAASPTPGAAAPTPTGTARATAVVAGQGGGTGTSTLPLTGNKTAPLVSGGGMLVAGGVALLLLARRRRARATS